MKTRNVSKVLGSCRHLNIDRGTLSPWELGKLLVIRTVNADISFVIFSSCWNFKGHFTRISKLPKYAEFALLPRQLPLVMAQHFHPFHLGINWQLRWFYFSITAVLAFILIGSSSITAQCCRRRGKKWKSRDDANVNKTTTTPSYSASTTKVCVSSVSTLIRSMCSERSLNGQMTARWVTWCCATLPVFSMIFANLFMKKAPLSRDGSSVYA